MSELVEHHLNIFVFDRNKRPIPRALVEVMVGHASNVIVTSTTTSSPSSPISISTAPTVEVLTIRGSAGSVTHQVTVGVDQQNVELAFPEIELPSMKPETTLAYAFGVVFVSAMLVLAVVFPNPTPYQYTVFRIVLALACSGVAAVIPGMIDVQVGGFVKAAGALAVFVIVFFYSPARLLIN